MIEFLRVLELPLHHVAERLVSIRDHVEEVTHRHDVTKHQVVAMIDEELQHDLQRRPFALQER